ncbi:hypothetical protein T484DRAFT_1743765 [Baffinella frigidus]|nr:hypothetical protein T484DRAFT_1743765 [Cryptophyta sp. CCMP2293]
MPSLSPGTPLEMGADDIAGTIDPARRRSYLTWRGTPSSFPGNPVEEDVEENGGEEDWYRKPWSTVVGMARDEEVHQFWEQERDQTRVASSELEFAVWQHSPSDLIVVNVFIGVTYSILILYPIANGKPGMGLEAERIMNVAGLLNAACCFLVAAVNRNVFPPFPLRRVSC